ncbi:MAG: hypothetical protein QOK22_2222 [Gaiellaceae bacterium]|nr:hypothetical protein [Gaiellaceae bacterium]
MADRRLERLRGAYYRAYVEQAEGELGGAAALLEDIRAALAEAPFADDVFRARVERLYARVLLHAGDARGRTIALQALDALGGMDAPVEGDEHRASMLSDLCVELNAIGAHDEAVAIMRRTLSVAKDMPLRAIRLTNLAAYLTQRATVRRVTGNIAEARDDLTDALAAGSEAISIRKHLADAAPEHFGLAQRQSQTEVMSATVELAAIDDVDLDSLYASARTFVRETLDERHAPVYDLATRIGRLGCLHQRRAERAEGAMRHASGARAIAYLHYGWELSSRTYVRPWLPLELHHAVRSSGDVTAARRFAEAALTRLTVQCGAEYPPCVRLSAAATT